MAWAEVVSDTWEVMPSPSETIMFGVSVGRLSIGVNWINSDIDFCKLLEELSSKIEKSEFDLLILRCPSGLIGEINKIHLPNRKLVFTGTLVYWELDCVETQFEKTSEVNISTAVELGTGRFDEILDVVDSSFRGYRNHYSANPNLNISSATASYRNWAESILMENPERVILAIVEHKIAGIVISQQSDAGPLEVLLAGVGSDFQRKGVYTALLGGVANIAKSHGVRNAVISTQSENIAVQRAWSKAGFMPIYSLDTFHIQEQK